MRVLYDGVIYRIQKCGGVVRYFNGLIHNLPAAYRPILLAPNSPESAPQHPNLATHIETCGRLFWPIKPLRKQIIAQRTYRRICAEDPDLIHPTYYYSSMRHLASRIKKPTVLTVYDLIHERFPVQMDPFGKQVRLKKEALQRADAVICISQSTKDDLLQYYSIPESRIEIIHLGCDFETTRSIPHPDQKSPFLLFVGSRDFHKNFERLLHAFSQLHRRSTGIHLRCVGGTPFTRSERQIIEKLDLGQMVHWTGFLGDAAMKKAYRDATALVYPSLYEGFGIPILEAMHCGTPVVTSNLASMPEVAGDAAILFDPYECDSISAALELVLDSTVRARLVTAGLQRASHFSWAKTAAATAKVYQNVTGIATDTTREVA